MKDIMLGQCKKVKLTKYDNNHNILEICSVTMVTGATLQCYRNDSWP